MNESSTTRALASKQKCSYWPNVLTHKLARAQSNEYTYLDVDVADLVDSSDYRSSDYRWEYVSREVGAGVSTLDELQRKIASVRGIRKGCRPLRCTCLIRRTLS